MTLSAEGQTGAPVASGAGAENSEGVAGVALPEATAEAVARAGAVGRARVREVLLAPLAGLAARRGQTVAERAAELAELEDRLAYMSAAGLRGLADCVLRAAGEARAGAKGAPAWPPVAQVRAWASVLEVPPPRSSDYLPSVLRSRLGARAQAEGWLVELYRDCARRGPPIPGEYQIAKLRETAVHNRRRLERAREAVAVGLTREHGDWLAAFLRDEGEAEALVAEGRAHRAAMGAAMGAANGGGDGAA